MILTALPAFFIGLDKKVKQRHGHNAFASRNGATVKRTPRRLRADKAYLRNFADPGRKLTEADATCVGVRRRHFSFELLSRLARGRGFGDYQRTLLAPLASRFRTIHGGVRQR